MTTTHPHRTASPTDPTLTDTLDKLAALSVEELGALIGKVAAELGNRPDPRAVDTLAGSFATIGMAMGKRWAWAPTDAEVADCHPNAVGTNDAVGEPAGRAFPFTMYGIREETPGPRWQALFEATWPAYRAWYLSEGDDARPDLATCRARLAKHMPELLPTWEAMVALAGEDEVAARMLTHWDLPQFLPGCSQAVIAGERPVLVRNYDYSPDLFEGVVYSSAFNGRRVIGTGDCLWGLLDGMNEDGLVVSLTFGGRPGSAPGFAIPLVVRYLLEVATTVDEAKQALDGLPISMAYNLTITDASGQTVTAYVAPGQQPEYTDAMVATNHRGTTPEYPDHARSLRSVERQDHLVSMLDEGPDREDLVAEFLRDPLYSTGYSRGFGTVYTAIYRPDEGTVEYRWPETSFTRTFDSPDATKAVVLRER